jgi:hypothetical protein
MKKKYPEIEREGFENKWQNSLNILVNRLNDKTSLKDQIGRN